MVELSFVPSRASEGEEESSSGGVQGLDPGVALVRDEDPVVGDVVRDPLWLGKESTSVSKATKGPLEAAVRSEYKDGAECRIHHVNLDTKQTKFDLVTCN